MTDGKSIHMVGKGWFPYDRYDYRCDGWKKRLATVLIVWKTLFSDRSDHSSHMAWKPAYMETAQRSKLQRPLNFFGSDRSDHRETSLKSKWKLMI